MSVTDNSRAASDQAYQRQMTSYRRTRSAILESAKKTLQTNGFSATSMIDIADTAQVSRATLYNHYRDKASVFRAMCEQEISEIFSAARRDPTRAGALAVLGFAISGDPALGTIRQRDPGLLTSVTSDQNDPLWTRIHSDLFDLFGDRARLVLVWLIGQVFLPLSPEEIDFQVTSVAGE